MSPPEQPKSQNEIKTRPELPAITERQVLDELVRAVKTGLADISNQLLDLTERVIKVEVEQKDLGARIQRNSDRTRGPSEHDLKSQAEIAKEIVARNALAADVAALVAKVDVLDRIEVAFTKAAKTFWETPTGKAVARLLGLATFVAAIVLYGALKVWALAHSIPLP